MTTHRLIDDDLQVLWELLTEMQRLVDEQFSNAIDAVVRGDLDQAKSIRDRDDDVDRLELKIDRECERILALQTPVAIDLRLIIAATRMNTDLERIGDYAKNLAKSVPSIAGSIDLVNQTQLVKMAQVARAILGEVREAFLKRDQGLARRVLSENTQVDALYEKTHRRLVELVQENPRHADAFVHLAIMSKGIERIADHAENIAEAVVFLIEGVDVRHQGLQQPLEE